MIRAVLDTNVLASGLAGLDLPASTPGVILSRWLEGTFELLISPGILAELDRTLNKPYFRSQRLLPHIEAAERSVRALAITVFPTTIPSGMGPHPEDDLVLAAAVSAEADYLVTGDKRFQEIGSYGGVTVLSPRAFLDLLEMTEDA